MFDAIRVSTLAIGAMVVICVLRSGPTFAAVTCDVQSIQATVPADTTITAAIKLDKPVTHCKIDGYVTATNPGPNRDYFRLQLPDKPLWKNRFYFIGLGGAAGYVPTNSQIPAGNPLVKGFAVAGTDTGHEGAILDWGFLNDPVKTLDHRDRGAHLTTMAAQAITKAYYGVTKMYRYESGCSGGGRMGGEAISRHPEDYDGVVLGEMSGINNNKTIEFSNYKFIHVAQVMNREPGAWLSPAKLKMVDKKVTEACDATDGAIDGIVWDHRACKFDFDSLKCKSGGGPDCLTQPEITSIKQILDGPRGPDGQRFSVGWPITNMSTWANFIGSQPPPWSKNPSPENMSKSSSGYIIAYTRGSGFFGPDFDPLTFNLKDQKNIDTWERLSRAQQFQGPPNPTPFEKAGGKLILFGGVSSPCCSNVEMEDWFNKYASQFGSEQTEKFMALYELPGVGHCGGGPGPQDGADVVMQALVDWVEADKQPADLVAHRGADRTKFMFAADADVPAVPLELTGNKPAPQIPTSGPSRDFLLCPYPQRAVFKGGVKNPDKLNVNDAANWSCKVQKS